jgi:hypothetical protein
LPEHAPQNAMEEPGEIARFYDRCSDLMRELLDGLSETPGRPRTFPEVEDAIGWPRRRIASVLGGAARMRQLEFGGRRPYRFHDERQSASGRWELWMDAAQAQAVRAARVWDDGERGPDPVRRGEPAAARLGSVVPRHPGDPRRPDRRVGRPQRRLRP